MSYGYQSFLNAPNIQERIGSDQFIAGNPTMKPGHIGMIRFLNDPVNTSAIRQQVQPGDGQTRTVELTYTPRINPATVQAGAPTTCTGGSVFGETSTQYSININTDHISLSANIPLLALSTRSQGKDDYVAEIVMKLMRAIVQRANRDAITAFNLLAGNFANGVAGPLSVATRAGNVFLPNPAEEIITQYELAEGGNVPFVIGGGFINRWFRAMAASCCASTNVLLEEYVNQNNMVHVYDPTFDQIIGANRFAVLEPGAMQMLSFNLYEGADVATANDDSFKAGILTDPLTGLRFDYQATRSCDQWTITLKLYRRFVTLPSDLFLTGDPLRGVNYLFPFTATAS